MSLATRNCSCENRIIRLTLILLALMVPFATARAQLETFCERLPRAHIANLKKATSALTGLKYTKWMLMSGLYTNPFNGRK